MLGRATQGSLCRGNCCGQNVVAAQRLRIPPAPAGGRETVKGEARERKGRGEVPSEREREGRSGGSWSGSVDNAPPLARGRGTGKEEGEKGRERAGAMETERE